MGREVSLEYRRTGLGRCSDQPDRIDLLELPVMSRKLSWHEPSNIVAAFAGLLSLISLLVSIRGCVVADQSLELARAEFRSQRTIILGGVVASDGDSIQLKALDSAVSLQQARALFPTAISKQEWPILPPDHKLHVVVLRIALQEAVEKRIGREPGNASVSLDANVPLIVTSLYAAKGEAFEDRSLYRIVYSFVINGDTIDPPKIEFQGLIYVQRLDSGADSISLLDQLWQQSISQK